MSFFSDAQLISFDFRSVTGPETREEIDVPAQKLLDGEVAHIVLEPGDATRYEFYLIPYWNDAYKPLGFSPFDASRYMLLVQRNLGRQTTEVCFSRKRGEVRYSMILNNDYTAELLTEYILLLAQQVYQIGMRRSAAFGRLDTLTRNLKRDTMKEDRDDTEV